MVRAIVGANWGDGSFATAAGGRVREQKELRSGLNFGAALATNKIQGTARR